MLDKYYGEYGGLYVPEVLLQPLLEIAQAFERVKEDEHFKQELALLLQHYAGRATPLFHAKNLSAMTGSNIYLKREDLLHGGAHKTNNTLGQCLLAKYMGKKRIIAETGAGQHGVATAMTGALLGIPVEIFMGRIDMERQAPNVARMQLFGAKVHAVNSGTATLKDAINDAMRDWAGNVEDTFYVFGTAAGPYPFPAMVRHFQSVIGLEAREQMLTMTGKLPDAIVACVGGGSNAIGLFSAFLADQKVAIYGAEAAGNGLNTHAHAATLEKGSLGVFHGMKSFFLQNNEGQINETHSISAGLDYPGVGPEHVYLQATQRATYLGITDDEALTAFDMLAHKEGILGALESCHAVALALKLTQNLPKNSSLLVNLSGRGDKDLNTVLNYRRSA